MKIQLVASRQPSCLSFLLVIREGNLLRAIALIGLSFPKGICV
jgi:hypothetical protein